VTDRTIRAKDSRPSAYRLDIPASTKPPQQQMHDQREEAGQAQLRQQDANRDKPIERTND
jgi:hypothetical protein